MNPVIQKFINQATTYYRDVHGGSSEEVDAELLAQLLIQRFIHLTYDQELSFHYLDEPVKKEGIREFRAIMKEHFGVSDE
jgi:hypothetical protein